MPHSRWLGALCLLLVGCGSDVSSTNDEEAVDAAPLGDSALVETTPSVGVDAPAESEEASVPDTAPPLDPDISDIPRNATAFAIGVMGGDAEPTRAMIWTRYTGKRELRARVSEAKDGKPTKVVLEKVVKPADGGFVHLDATPLTPGIEYQYAFLEHDGTKYVGRSDAGRFNTAIADDKLETLTFGGTSCNHINGAPFPSLAFAASAKLDFFIHTGDHIYGDAAETLGEYRNVYEKYWEVKNLSAVHRSTGMYTIWDDHEVVNNWASDTVSDARVKAARQAFFEHRAFRKNPTAPNRLWRSFRWGKTAEFFILDVRGERLKKNRLLASGAANPEAQFISDAQMSWLKSSLTASKAVFKFIVTSKYFSGPNDLGNDDSWPGWPAQRNELLNHVVKIDGVWFLTGDVHKGIIEKIQPSGEGAAIREIYMGPSGSGGDPNPGANYCNGTGQREVFLDVRSYTRLRADPVAKTLEVEFIGESGATLCKKKYPA
jgi:alkaline phosphatase D